MKRDFSKFLVTLSIIGVSVWAVGLAIDIICSKAFRTMPDHCDALSRYNYILNRMDVDLVVLGSSRASHHYNMSLLMDSVNSYSTDYKTYFNAGTDGHYSNCAFCVFESLLDRCQPKTVIIDINTSDFYLQEGENHSNITSFAPFYQHNNVVKDYIDRISYAERLKMQSPLYRYNGELLSIIKGIMFGTNGWSDGYQPLYTVMTPEDPISLSVKPSTTLNAYTVDNFERVLKLARERDVNLVIALSPRYNDNEIGSAIVSDICKTYSIPFVNMLSIDEFNNHPELFKDTAHLNHEGATYYSSLMFKYIKPYL